MFIIIFWKNYYGNYYGNFSVVVGKIYVEIFSHSWQILIFFQSLFGKF